MGICVYGWLNYQINFDYAENIKHVLSWQIGKYFNIFVAPYPDTKILITSYNGSVVKTYNTTEDWFKSSVLASLLLK
jgi:hypothetical protein